MRRLLIALLFCASAHAIPTCPVTVTNGAHSVTLAGVLSRSSGISPLTVWFDSTGTTDSDFSGNFVVFQDGNWLWNFADTQSSGKGNWSNGAQSAYSGKNLATGGIAAHMYLVPDGAGDQTYTPVVTYTNPSGTVTAACTPGTVQVFDPTGTNGWPGTATTCYANSTIGSGCPAGASQVTGQLTVPSLAVTNKRVLFKCGDTFTTNGVTVSGTKGSIGAYGGCQNTTTSRPIIRATAIFDGTLTLNNPSTDIRIADIALDGNCSGGGQSGSLACTGGVNGGTVLIDNQNGGTINSTGNKPSQYTLYNLDAKNQFEAYMWSTGEQMAIIGSTAQAVWQGCGFNCINVRFNVAGVGAGNSGTAGGCTPSVCNWTTFGAHEAYGALIGNNFTNGPNTQTHTSSAEVVRLPYMLKFVISNNTMTNAGGDGSGFGVFKIHNLSYSDNVSNGGTGAFNGTYYSQYNVIADNFFGGSSGFNMVDFRPQNAQSDERVRYTVLERNVIKGTQAGATARQILLSTTNVTIRNNTFVNAANVWGICISQQGPEPVPQFNEIYNNSFIGNAAEAIAIITGSNCGGTTSNAPNSNVVQNNLAFITGGNATVLGGGGVNTISNNTATTTNNPAFVNFTGAFSAIYDFKPTANYTGGTPVNVFSDALGVPWGGTYDLGAVHH